MKEKRLLGIFDGPDREWIEETARVLGLTPEATVFLLKKRALELNPSISVPDCPDPNQKVAKVLNFSLAPAQSGPECPEED